MSWGDDRRIPGEPLPLTLKDVQLSRRFDRSVPALLGVCVFVASVVAGGDGTGWPQPESVAIVSVAAGVAAAFARRSWWPLAVIGSVAYLWLVLWAPLIVASYYAGTTLRGARRVGAYLGGAAAVLATSIVIGRMAGGHREVITATPPNAAMMAVITVGLPLLYGLWVRAKRDVLAAARERADRLESEQVMRAGQARAQERARIAREMHDVVAHRVSLMVLHAGALEVRAADEQTSRTAALIGEIGRESLADLREVLGVLRSRQPAERSPQPTLADLDRLLEQSRALGISVRRHDHGEPRTLGATVERTAYRVVQEALTNVHKHAADAHTDVHVRFLPGALHVEVLNRATHVPAGAVVPGAGWGLAGLRERVELLGGTLEAGPGHEGGFGVLAAIPAAVAA